jgi:hypothetical protein
MPITIHGDGFITGLGNVSTSGNVVTNAVQFGDSSVQTAAAIGHGQTWQNVTSSRASAVTYTNTTGRPIMVVISMASGTVNGSVNLMVNGAIVSYANWSHNMGSISSGKTLVAIVPSGSTYRLNVVDVWSLSYWNELR